MAKQVRCTTCGQTFPNPYQLHKHRKLAHADTMRTFKKKPEPTMSAFDKLLDLKAQAKGVIEELEVERHQLHERIVKIDTIIAKFKRGESILE